MKGTKTEIADDPEIQRHKKNTQVSLSTISNCYLLMVAFDQLYIDTGSINSAIYGRDG